MDTPFHRGLRLARDLSRKAQQVFEHAIDNGLCTIDDVLSYDYREIKGAEIQSLGRLFDVSRVPTQGFDPPKYATRYDSVVDVELQRVMEETRHSDPMVLHCTVADLNLYLPIHQPELCQDWTGEFDKDVANNRMKRFFYDRWMTTEGVRVGLGSNSKQVPNRASREDFIQAGCQMRHNGDSDDLFSVKLQVRDTGAVVVAVQVPIFVRGHRYGAASCAWVAADGQPGLPASRPVGR
jgi:methyl-accepting chemotaxis protein